MMLGKLDKCVRSLKGTAGTQCNPTDLSVTHIVMHLFESINLNDGIIFYILQFKKKSNVNKYIKSYQLDKLF